MPKDNAPATPALNKTPDCDAELYQKSPDEMAKILERRESESGEDETSGGVPRGRVSLGRGSRGSGARRPPHGRKAIRFRGRTGIRFPEGYRSTRGTRITSCGQTISCLGKSSTISARCCGVTPGKRSRLRFHPAEQVGEALSGVLLCVRGLKRHSEGYERALRPFGRDDHGYHRSQHRRGVAYF